MDLFLLLQICNKNRRTSLNAESLMTFLELQFWKLLKKEKHCLLTILHVQGVPLTFAPFLRLVWKAVTSMVPFSPRLYRIGSYLTCRTDLVLSKSDRCWLVAGLWHRKGKIKVRIRSKMCKNGKGVSCIVSVLYIEQKSSVFF